MKKWFSIFLLLSFFILPVCAAQDYSVQEVNLPSQTQDFLDQYGDGAQQLEDLTLQGLWDSLVQTVSNQLSRPMRMVYQLTAILVLAALVKAFCTDWSDQQIEKIIEMVVILAAFLFACKPLLELLVDVGESIAECKTFLYTFIPVFAGVMASCGQPAASAVYTGFFLSAVTAFASLIAGILLPFLKIYMALNIAGGLSTTADLSGLAKLIAKFIKWGLGLVATIFGAVIGLQSLLAGAADSVALKTGKFLIGSGVPVIGSAVSDAIGTVYAGLKVVKGTAGAAGIVAIVALFAPILIRCFIYLLALNLASAAAVVTGNSRAGNVFRGFCECLELYISILVFFAVMTILSTALMISLGTG